MQYFLQQIARDITSRYGQNLEQTCIVFPNRRAGIFFKRYLARSLDQPIWSPAILPISDLMEQLSGLQKADQLSLLFDLHQIFQQQKHREETERETFDEFYHWGEMLLRDFDDVDKYLADARDVFRNLAELKSIDQQFSYLEEDQLEAIRQFWNALNVQAPSQQQQDFISIWEILYHVYLYFNQSLDEQGRAYEGKIYRAVVECIRAGQLELPHARYIFVGFNALTPAEKALFHELRNRNMADFYWDYDQAYLKNHEAGRFIGANLREFPGHELNIHDNLNHSKNIRFINTPYDIAQAKILPDLLNRQTSGGNESPDKTAVVLPDEKLLLPVLNSLPEDLSAVNVTMGYPVYSTPAFSLLVNLIQLQQNMRKASRGEAFYYQDVLAVLNHQYMGVLRDEQIENLSESIHRHNKIYIEVSELQVTDLLKKVFTVPGDFASLSDYLLESYRAFYTLLRDQVSEQDESLKMELESIYYVYLTVKRLKEVFENKQVQVGMQTYLRILQRVIQSQSIPFQGEPLSGLQVMGILETRALDFDHLIILSMNEGVFPSGESTPSFIPFNLRKGFGLPTHEQKDAMYAYYFYRLMQRARQVTLVYNSGTDGINTGEMSRFMHQLKLESPHPITEETVVSDLSIPSDRAITVPKTPAVMKLLEQYNTHGKARKTLSPSALKTYLACPLKFYFKHLAGLTEPHEITEEVDLPLFGSILHKALQLIYGPYKKQNQPVSSEEMDKMAKNHPMIEDKITEAFRAEYFSDIPSDQPLDLSGKNLLIRDIIHKYIVQLLKAEQSFNAFNAFAPFTPIGLEAEYRADVPFQTKQGEKQITLEGTIDRVDDHPAGIRIIDYKTGRSVNGFADVPALFTTKGHHDALQALLYARLYEQNEKPDRPLIPGLYYIRDIYSDRFDYRLKMNKKPVDYHQVADELDQQLQRTLAELFNPNQPFVQTEEEKNCHFCPYAAICRREQHDFQP